MCRPNDPLSSGQVGRKPYQILARAGGDALKQQPLLTGPEQRFSSLIPARPYCTNDPSSGVKIRSRSKALQYRLLQLNGPHVYAWLCFDVDRPDVWTLQPTMPTCRCRPSSPSIPQTAMRI